MPDTNIVKLLTWEKSYKKINWQNGVTALSADNLNVMDSGIYNIDQKLGEYFAAIDTNFNYLDNSFLYSAQLAQRMFNDLYNQDANSSDLIPISNTTILSDIATISSDREYDDATYTGFGAYIGSPSEIDVIRTALKPLVSGQPITAVHVTIRGIPTTVSANGNYYNPEPWNFTILYEETVKVDVALSADDSYKLVDLVLGQTFTNYNKYHLYLEICANNPVGIKFVKQNFPNIPFNTWGSYATIRNAYTNNWLYNASAINLTSKDVYCLPVEIYKLSNRVDSSYIDTDVGGSFYNYVQEALSNSETYQFLDNVQDFIDNTFDTREKVTRVGGSVYNVSNPDQVQIGNNNVYGITFCIGKIRGNFNTFDIALNTGNNDSYTYTVRLYTTLSIPTDNFETTIQNFGQYNPSLLDEFYISVVPDENGNVKLSWSIDSYKEFIHNKFVWISIFNNQPFKYFYAKPNALTVDVISQNEGSSIIKYNTIYKYELAAAPASDVTPNDWINPILDVNSIAYVISYESKDYYLGDKFGDAINEVVDQKTQDLQAQINKIKPIEVSAHLKENYYVPIGEKIQFYFNNIFNVDNLSNYHVKVSSPIGSQTQNYWEATSFDADTSYTVIFNLYDLNWNNITSGITTINFTDNPNYVDPTTLNALLIGGENSSNGVMFKELISRLNTINNLNITTVGPNSNGDVKYLASEDYSGDMYYTNKNNFTTCEIQITCTDDHNLTSSDLYTLWNDGLGYKWMLYKIVDNLNLTFKLYGANTLQDIIVSNITSLTNSIGTTITVSGAPLDLTKENPFYSSDGISIKKYVDTLATASLDLIIIDLNIDNLILWSANEKLSQTIINNIRSLVELAATEYPQAMIIGIGASGHSLVNTPDIPLLTNSNMAELVHSINGNIQTIFESLANDNPDKYIYFIDPRAEFDNRNGFISEERQINLRSTKTEIVPLSAYRLSEEGNLLTADAVYREMANILITDAYIRSIKEGTLSANGEEVFNANQADDTNVIRIDGNVK